MWVEQLGFTALGAAMGVLLGQLFTWLSERSGSYAGYWEAEVVDEQGGIIRKDSIRLQHSGAKVRGRIRRTFPENQKHRQWKLAGRIEGKDFFATYWSSVHTDQSYGAFYLHQISDDLFTGNYLRLSRADHGKVDTIPIKFFRMRRRIRA
jgi:hypothetical protein